MPPKSKYARALDAVPLAKTAATFLTEAGRADLAAAVEECAEFTRAHATPRAKKWDDADKPNQSLQVTEEFREHVYAQVEERGEVPLVVIGSLEEFVAGDWEPPYRRVTRNTNPTWRRINVRVPKDLWAAANERGKDPAEVARRGYKLTASSIAIAALEERFGQPAPQGSEEPAAP